MPSGSNETSEPLHFRTGRQPLAISVRRPDDPADSPFSLTLRYQQLEARGQRNEGLQKVLDQILAGWRAEAYVYFCGTHSRSPVEERERNVDVSMSPPSRKGT